MADTRLNTAANFPTDVSQMLDLLSTGIQTALGNNLVGLYLRGSLAMGDFDPANSDLDFFAVTKQPVTAREFADLVELHTQLSQHSNPFGRHLEGPYIDRAATRRFRPGERYPTIGRGETLAITEHGENWILERWTVREHGIVLIGPDPKALIDPISSTDLIAATRTRLRDWAEWADQLDDPDWQLPRAHKAYVVETMCRALFTLTHGELISKPGAVRWALATLDEPYRTTVERSIAWRTDNTIDLSIIPAVRDFVNWAAAQAKV